MPLSTLEGPQGTFHLSFLVRGRPSSLCTRPRAARWRLRTSARQPPTRFQTLTRLTSPAAYASPSFCRYRPTRTSTSSSIDLDAGSPSPAAFYHSIRHVSVSRLDRLVGREQRPRRCYRPRLICHAASAPTVFCTLVGLYVLSVWFSLLVPSLIDLPQFD